MTFTYPCIGCKHPFKIESKKPGALTPVTLTVKCPECFSKIVIRVSKPRKADNPRQIRVDNLKIAVSHKLAGMLKEGEGNLDVRVRG